MKPIRYADRPTIVENDLTEMPGLSGYIPFVVIPHWENDYYKEKVRKVAGEYIEKGKRVITINDSECVIVIDNKIEIY